jgi:hypothetical protein
MKLIYYFCLGVAFIFGLTAVFITKDITETTYDCLDEVTVKGHPAPRCAELNLKTTILKNVADNISQ